MPTRRSAANTTPNMARRTLSSFRQPDSKQVGLVMAATSLSFGQQEASQDLVYVRGKVCSISGCSSGLFFYSACRHCKRKANADCCSRGQKKTSTYKRYLLRCRVVDESLLLSIVAFGNILDVRSPISALCFLVVSA